MRFPLLPFLMAICSSRALKDTPSPKPREPYFSRDFLYRRDARWPINPN